MKFFTTKIFYLLTSFLLLFTSSLFAFDRGAEKGVLDLRAWNPNSAEVELKGEWAFYWNELYTLSDIEDTTSIHTPTYIPASESWTINEHPAYGYATYHLKILLPSEVSSLGLKTAVMGSANKIYVGDQLFSESGQIATAADQGYVPFIDSKVIYIPVSSSEVDLFIQVANFSHKRAGMIEMFSLGTPENITHHWSMDIMRDLFLCGALLIMGLYHIGIFILRRKVKAPLYFALFCIIISARIIFTGNYIVNEFHLFGYESIIRVNYLTFYLGALSFALFTYYLFPKESSSLFIKFSVVYSLFFTLKALLFPSPVYTEYLLFFQIFTLALGIYFTIVLVLANINKRQGAIIFSATWLLLFASIIYDILAVIDIVPDDDYTATGLFIFIFAQSYLLSARFSNAFEENEKLSEKLNYTNQNLEVLVDEKTISLKKANEQLSVQHDNIQNSIQYAKRIQDSILSNQLRLSDALEDGFVYFNPRDKVSGDFFWTEKVGNKSIVIAADCTGHGVPGAFMSLIGFEGLNQVILQKGHLDPSEILREMHLNIRRSLNQKENAESRDGMDMGICVYDHDTHKIQFSGAKRPLYIIKDGKLEEIKGDKLPIGGQYRGQERSYTTHEIQGDPNAYYYMCSDGYQDQFGGKDDRKFMVGKFKKLLVSISEEKGDKQKQLLERRFKSWRRGQRQIDDVLVLGFQLPNLS